jgi:hypothetical protein
MNMILDMSSGDVPRLRRSPFFYLLPRASPGANSQRAYGSVCPYFLACFRRLIFFHEQYFRKSSVPLPTCGQNQTTFV